MLVGDAHQVAMRDRFQQSRYNKGEFSHVDLPV
jgi:hypothetical protein